MSTVQTTPMTAEEFWSWASRPENQDKLYELDRGEVVATPPPGWLHGALCGWIAHLLWSYVLRRGAGMVTTNDAGLLVGRDPDTVRGPDVMLFSVSRRLEELGQKFSEELPQLIVEVLSPNDRWSRLSPRIRQYEARGVPLIGVVDPEERAITVHRPGELPQVVDEQHELVGNGVLPDFSLPASSLFHLPGSSPVGEASA
jgi:Uma2 family endonuclease